jgi:FixJ family two-component response regulator
MTNPATHSCSWRDGWARRLDRKRSITLLVASQSAYAGAISVTSAGSPSMGICRGHVSVGRRPSPGSANSRRYSAISSTERVRRMAFGKICSMKKLSCSTIASPALERSALKTGRIFNFVPVVPGPRLHDRFHVRDTLHGLAVVVGPVEGEGRARWRSFFCTIRRGGVGWPAGMQSCCRSPVSLIGPDVREQLRMSSSVFVHVVDDDKAVRESIGDLLRSMDYQVKLYGSASEFLKVELPDAPACLVLDVRLPGTSGLELQEYLARIDIRLPVILMTGFGDIPMSVRGMKKGAVDFLTKPIRDQDLLDAVAAAIRMDQDRRCESAQVAQLREKYALLTSRERQVMALVASGLMNKQIANELSISEVTVKMHRGSVMRKFGARSVAILARIAQTLHIKR